LDYLRFRKGFSNASFNNMQSAQDLKELNKLDEQTVFIIQANKL
jgi:hypothetical protein